MKRLFSSSKYGVIFSLSSFITVSVAFLLVLTLYFPHESSTSNKVFCIIFFAVLAIIFFISFLLSFQYAILDANGITIKCLIFKLISIKWKDLTSVNLETNEIATNNIGIKLKKSFITFYTNNKKLRIIYSAKNWSILKDYLETYNKQINLNTF